MTKLLVDTGPLVAYFSSKDVDHPRCKEALDKVEDPLWTTWPVLAETAYLLRRSPGGLKAIFALLERRGLVALHIDSHVSAPWFAAFFEKYRDLGVELADASLIYVAERDGFDSLYTLDRRHFLVYRLASGRMLSLLPAEL